MEYKLGSFLTYKLKKNYPKTKMLTIFGQILKFSQMLTKMLSFFA